MDAKKAVIKTNTDITIFQVFSNYYCSLYYEGLPLDDIVKDSIRKRNYTLSHLESSEQLIIESAKQQIKQYIETSEFLEKFNTIWNKLYKYIKLYEVEVYVEMNNTQHITFKSEIKFKVDSEIIHILEYLPNNSIAFVTKGNSHLRFVQLTDHIKCYLID